MGNKFKRFLALFLAVMMVVSYVPTNVFATENGTEETPVVENPVEETPDEGEADAQSEESETDAIDTEAELAAALAAGGEVKLGGDINVATQIEILADKTVVLDLAGYDIIGGQSGTKHIYVLSNKGTLTVNDSVGDGKIVSRGVYNYGSLTLNGGVIEACDGDGGYAVNNESGSTFVMNGGAVVTTYDDDPITFETSDATAIDVCEGNTTTINGGTVSCVSNWCYAISSNGTLNITNTKGNVKVSGVHGAVSVNGGTTTIDGGEFVCVGATNASSDHVLYASAGSLTVNDGTFTNNNKDAGSNGAAVCLEGSAASATINKGTFTGCEAAVYGNANTVVNGGSYTLHWNDIHDTEDNLAQYVATNATVTVDGAKMTKTENGLEEVVTPTDVKVATLAELQAALASDSTLPIVITATIVIPEGETVTIDLNGKTVIGNFHKSNGAVIENQGTLTLKNGTVTSGANNGGSALLNKGTATVIGVTLNGAPNADGSWPSYTVNNIGSLEITGSKITSYHGAVCSYAEGAVVTLTGTDIEMSGIPGFTSHALYTYNNGSIVVNSGNIANNAADQNGTGGSVINGAVTVNGGTFNGRVETYSGKPVIKGGTFKYGDNVVDVSKYVPEGYEYNATTGEVTKEAPEGNDFTGYTREDAIWGETWGNASESFVIKVLDANGNVMGTTSLNNIGGILDGDVNVTWSLKLDAASNTDEYWTMNWTTAPSVDNMPAKVELWVDGVKVSGGDVVLNGPDEINKIYAAEVDADGKITGYCTLDTFVSKIGDLKDRRILVLRDVSFSSTEIRCVEFISGVEGGVTVTNTDTENWIDFDFVTIGKGVTVNVENPYSGDSENVIEGTLNAGDTFYHGYDAKTTVQNGGKVTVGGTTILRYNENADSGIYIYGDGDDSTVEFDCDYYIGAYSGTFYAKDANIETGYFLLKNSYDNSNYADVAMTLDNSSLTVVGTTDTQDSFIIDDQASLTLKNGASIEDVRDFNILAGTNLELTVDDASSISATYVNIAEDVALEATKNDDGTVTFKKILKGTGTAEDPFLINNVEDLLWFQAKVDEQASDGSTQFAGQYFKLNADIDLAGINWNPIGSMSGDHGSFKGVFDGGNHTISNLSVEQAGNGLGLFARTAGNAVIKNLKLVNVTVKSTDNSNYVGGLVGNAYASTKIENVHVSGDILISGRGYIGGIAGHGYVVMDKVSVKGNEGSRVTSTFWCAGGILGYGGEGTTDIKNAHVEGLTITSAAGGLGAIVGMAEDNNGTQPISGSNLSAKDVEIKTYVGAYGTSYEDYAMGYLYGGNPTSELTGTLTVENVDVKTASGNPASINDAVATIGDTIYFDLQSALNAAAAGTGEVTVEILRDIDLTNVDWSPVTVSAPGYPVVTVKGNGKTIRGLNDMLFAGTWAGGSGLIINDLTIRGANIAHDVDDAAGNIGVGAFIGYPQASATITLKNCHLVDSTVKGGHWTGGLIGMAGGYNGNDGPVFMNLTITGCSVTGSTITGKGSVGGVIGHGSCAAWTNVVIENTTVSGNTITSTGSSTVKAGSVMGTIGAAGQSTTAAGETKTGGASVSATVSGNTVASGGTPITTIYGRQGTSTGVLTLTGGTYDSYPIEENVTYAAPTEGFKIAQNEDGTYGVVQMKQLIINVANPVATAALIEEVINVATMDEAVAKAKEINADYVIYKVYGPVELTTGYEHVILDLGKNVVIEGVTNEAKLTIVGGGVPDIKGVTFKNITIADKGEYLPTANEFMYQNFIDCSFKNVTFEDGIRVSGTTTITGCTVNANTANEYAIWMDEGDFTMTGTTVTAGNDAYGLLKSDVVDTITITGNTFEYLGNANKEALNVKGAKITASNNKFIDCTEGVLPADKTNYAADGTVITNADLTAGNIIEVNVAKIGDKKYESLADAFAAAQANDTVTLLADVSTDASVVVTQNLTIDGNGHKLTVTGAYGIDVKAGVNLVINNLTLESNSYAINLRGASDKATVEINDSYIKGYGALNIWGTDVTVNVNNSTLHGHNALTDNSNAFAAIVLNAKPSINEIANGTKVNVNGGKIITSRGDGCEVMGVGRIDSETGEINISNTTVIENNGGVDQLIQYAVARRGDVICTSLQGAIDNAATGETVTLLRNVTIDTPVTITKNVVIDGNGKTLTYTGTDRAIDVPKTAVDADVAISDLTLNFTGGYSQRGINYNTNGKLTLDKVTVNGTNVTYAVNLPGSSDGAEVTITDSDITGLIALNVWGENAKVNVTDTALTSVDNATHENYAAVKLNNNGTDAAEGAVITITGGSITALDENDKPSSATTNSTSTGKIIISDTTTVTGKNDEVVAVVLYDGASEFYGCFSLQDAIERAANDSKATVKLLKDITTSEPITINGGVVIDLNSKTITSGVSTIVVDGGDLTVKDSGTTGKIITTDVTGNYEAIAVKNGGKLTLDGGAVESGCYGIYAYTSGGDIVMNGGSITLSGVNADGMAIAVGSDAGSATITGGKIDANGVNWPMYTWGGPISITGGTFDFNPSAAYVAYGYGTEKTTVDGETWYQVVKIDPVAYIGTTGYYTIAAAIENANPGDTVTVNTYTHSGDLKIDKDITLEAADNAVVTINGQLQIEADGVTVKGLKVNCGGTALSINAKDVLVEYCEITGDWSGMYQSYTTGKVTFKDSKITGKSGYAIHFDGSAGGEIVIDNCELSGWTSLASTIKKVTVTDTEFVENDVYNYVRFYQENVVINGCTFNEKMEIDLVDVNSVTVTGSTVTNGTVEDLFFDEDIVDSTITVDSIKLVREAKIGDVYYETIAEAIAAVGAGDVVIDLVANATLDYKAREAYGTAETTSLTINGNGKTLTLNQKDSDWSSIGLANADAKLVLNDMTIEKTGYGDTSGAWNTHAIKFTCDVEMNNVTVNNSVDVESNATLNNVTINEANGYYGLWITGEGKTVTVNGGEINATNGGRGIKIADQYVGTPKQVTLKVTDTKFNTANKAAVLVTSTAGAKVTANGVDISGVAEDTVNFVWVDEDRAANFGNVEVTGATKAQEAVETFNIVVKDGDKIVSYFKTLEEAAAQIATDGSDTTIKILQDVEVGSDIEFVYGTGKVTFEADTPVTIKQTALGTDFDFTKQLANNIVIGKNVTFEVYDNSSGIYLYYGPSLELNGTITGGQNWGALYLFQGEHTVTETGKIGTGRTQIGYTTLTVKGEVDTNYLLVEGSTFTADGATVDAGVIYDNNNGGQRWGASTFNITNSSVVNAGTVTLSYADSVLTIDMSSTLNATTITGAGKIVIDAKDYTSGAACPITGNASTFAGTLEVINNDNVVASIDEDGNIVLTEIVYVAQVGETKYETLQEAVNAAKANDVITLLADVDADEVIVVKKPLTINANGHTITEDNVACTKYTNSEGKKVVLTTEVDGDTIVVKPAVLSSEEAGETAAYIVGDENNLMTLQDALDAAAAGETVKLTGNVTVNSTVIIPTDVTLDIESNTLTVKTLIGLNGSKLTANAMATNGTGSGVLKVAKDNVLLSQTTVSSQNNMAILPVWVDDCYQFAAGFTTYSMDGQYLKVTEDEISLRFRHRISSYYKTMMPQDGGLAHGMKVVVKLTWENPGNGVAEQTFVYNDGMFKTVADDTHDYTFKLTNYKELGIDLSQGVTLTMGIITDCGVETYHENIQLALSN